MDQQIHFRINTLDDDVVQELNRMLDEGHEDAFLARDILGVHEATTDIVKGFQTLAQAGVFQIEKRQPGQPYRGPIRTDQ